VSLVCENIESSLIFAAGEEKKNKRKKVTAKKIYQHRMRKSLTHQKNYFVVQTGRKNWKILGVSEREFLSIFLQ
jgi:hypothetical protein